MLPRVDIPNYTGNGGGCIGQYKSTPWQNPYGAPAGSDTCGPKTDFKFGWTPLADSEGLHVLYCSYDNNLSPQPAGVTVRGYDYKKYEAGAVHYMPPFRFPGQYFDEETGFHENWNRYYEPQTGRYLSPEPFLQSVEYVRRATSRGMLVLSYGYSGGNPLRFVDPTGLLYDVPCSQDWIAPSIWGTSSRREVQSAALYSIAISLRSLGTRFPCRRDEAIRPALLFRIRTPTS